MIIDIISKYEVLYVCDYSYINEYGDFSSGKEESKEILEGKKLLEQIISLIQDFYFWSINIKSNLIFIENFDPTTGEFANYKFLLKEIIE